MGLSPFPPDLSDLPLDDVGLMEEGPPSLPLPPPPVEKVEIGTSIDLTDDEKTALKLVFDRVTDPDDSTRERMVPIWQMYENYWRGLQDVIWDESSSAFVSAAGVLKQAGELEDTYIGSKIVNVYRSHGESIAAAVSAGTPTVKFFPEDADDPQDITTAKTYSIASEFIADDNESKLLHLRAIYTRWNQPFVAYYNTYVYGEEYGEIERREYGVSEVETPESFCPSCGEEFPVQTPNGICPDCGIELTNTTSSSLIPSVTKITKIPKGKEKIEVYGPRHVRVPYNVKELKQSPYLILETEHNWAYLLDLYPQLEEIILEGSNPESTTGDVARRARRAGEAVEPDRDQNTLYRAWIRRWAFNYVKDEATKASLRLKFPDGVQVTFVDEHFVEAYNESMDEHWTLVPDPFAEHIHGDPLGKPVVPIQDMTNDVVQLTLEHILFGIPDRFADPKVLNFDKYGKTEKTPGLIFPATRPPGMGLDAGFTESRAATLSDNVEIFRQSLEMYAQNVTGDYPGIHGGPLPKGSSRTADEYRQAKQSALQRLSIIWLVINMAWSIVMKKAVNELRLHMVFQGEDIKFVKEAGNGFANVWIKLADIDEGNIGRVRSESADTFPLTTEQQRGAMLELIQTGIPPAFEWMFAPENLGETSRILIGLNRFHIPGEEDRDYQLWEIHNLLNGGPAEVNQDMDNHELHIAVIRTWAAGEDGRKTQEANPQGFMAVMEHLQQHSIIMESMLAQQQVTQQQQQQPERLPPGKKGNGEAASPGAM